jgi:hypothetical protein
MDVMDRRTSNEKASEPMQLLSNRNFRLQENPTIQADAKNRIRSVGQKGIQEQIMARSPKARTKEFD